MNHPMLIRSRESLPSFRDLFQGVGGIAFHCADYQWRLEGSHDCILGFWYLHCMRENGGRQIVMAGEMKGSDDVDLFTYS